LYKREDQTKILKKTGNKKPKNKARDLRITEIRKTIFVSKK